jgi:hypothetical protein
MTILASVNNKTLMAGITPIADVPDAPTIGTVTVTNATTVSVPFTAATTGGTPTSYTVTATPSVGDISTNAGTSSPRTVTGTFVTDTAYTFKIRGVNSTATGPESSASNSVTPLVTPPNTFVTIAYGTNSSATSTNGADWTSRTMPSIRNWYALYYANGRFVTAGGGSTVGAYSEDGITWTTIAFPSAKSWSQTGFGNSRWVINGQNQPSAYAVSTDNGVNWSDASAGGGFAGSSSVFGNGVFVSAETTANAGVNAWYSSNGTSWTNGGSLGATAGWGRGYYNASGGGFIITANTSSNYVSQSTTGTGSWTLRTLPTTANWGGCLAYGNGVWSYLTNTAAASSTDGITWSSRTTPAAIGHTSMWYSASMNLFVAVAGSSGVAYTSSTGTGSWTSRTLPSTNEWYSVASTG